MNWLRHNLKFTSGVVVASGLLLAAISYGWSGWSNNAAQVEELRQRQAELRRLEQVTPTLAAGRGAQVEAVSLRCRAVDRSQLVSGANELMAHELKAQLTQSPWLSEVKLDERIEVDAALPGTFLIGVTVKIKQPSQLAAAQ